MDENQLQAKEKFVPLNIQSIVENYNPKLNRVIPKWYYRRLVKLLHVDELNSFLSENYNKDSQDFLDATVEFLKLKTKIIGIENLTNLRGQNPIIVANHPMGGPEAMALFKNVYPIFPETKILMQSFLCQLRPMRKISVYNHNLLKTTLECVKQGDPLIMFPAGLCSHKLAKGKGVADNQWKATFVKLAKRYDRVIVPIYISGALSNRIHNWYDFRHFVHMKLSVETMYLVDEMFRLGGSEIEFRIGQPIYPDTLKLEVRPDIMAGRIRQYIYDLKENPNLEFDPMKKDVFPLPKHNKKTYQDI